MKTLKTLSKMTALLGTGWFLLATAVSPPPCAQSHAEKSWTFHVTGVCEGAPFEDDWEVSIEKDSCRVTVAGPESLDLPVTGSTDFYDDVSVDRWNTYEIFDGGINDPDAGFIDDDRRVRQCKMTPGDGGHQLSCYDGEVDDQYDCTANEDGRVSCPVQIARQVCTGFLSPR